VLAVTKHVGLESWDSDVLFVDFFHLKEMTHNGPIGLTVRLSTVSRPTCCAWAMAMTRGSAKHGPIT
jgi:hypothetical protein